MYIKHKLKKEILTYANAYGKILAIETEIGPILHEWCLKTNEQPDGKVSVKTREEESRNVYCGPRFEKGSKSF